MAPNFPSRLRQFPWSKIKYSSIPARDAPAWADRASMDRNSDEDLLEKGRRFGRDGAPQQQQSLWRNGRFLLAHSVLFSLYAFILFLVANSKARRDNGMPFSPAIDVIDFEETFFTLEDRIQDASVYTGKPSKKLDQAWHDLLAVENIMLEPEYIRHYGREDISVAIPEGGGFIGTLNVYHELHCLKRIHQFMYPEYYFPDLTPHQHELNRKHNAHCIDFLRQSAMCHGDIGLITYNWRPDVLMPVANATSHQCVNWGSLEGWMRARTVDMMKPGWLIHPTKGPAYPDGQGDKLGAAEVGHVHG